MSFTDTNGRKPRIEGPFMVRYRSGWVSGPFEREQLRWTDEGSQWCIVGAQRVPEGTTQGTWSPDGFAAKAAR